MRYPGRISPKNHTGYPDPLRKIETQMVSLGAIREMFEYNYWARDQQLGACSALTSDQFTRPLGSSFSSLRGTLAHLVTVEWVYLERWLGGSPTLEQAEEYAPETFPDLRAVEDRWRPIERGVRDYVAHLPEDRLAEPLTYLSLEGERWTYPLWRVMFHLINHQTYHRGQVTTLLRQLGVKPREVDFLTAHDVQFRC